MTLIGPSPPIEAGDEEMHETAAKTELNNLAAFVGDLGRCMLVSAYVRYQPDGSVKTR